MPLSSSTGRPDSSHVYENAAVRVTALSKSEQIPSSCGRNCEQPTKYRFPHSTDTYNSGCHVPYSYDSRSQRYLRVNHPCRLTRNLNKHWSTDRAQDKDEQLQMLAGFSSTTLRGLIIDYVLELLKSHLQPTTDTILSTIETRKVHTPNDHYELTSSFNDRSNCDLFANQPRNGDDTRRLVSKSNRSLPKVGRTPRVHLKPHHSLPVQSISQANEFYPIVSTSTLRPKEPEQDSRKSFPSDRVQNRADELISLTNSRNQQSSHTIQPKSQVRNVTGNQCSSFTSRRGTKSPKPPKAHRDTLATKQTFYVQQRPADLSVRSSLRGTRTYSADCTSKKLRFERIEDFRSPV